MPRSPAVVPAATRITMCSQPGSTPGGLAPYVTSQTRIEPGEVDHVDTAGRYSGRRRGEAAVSAWSWAIMLLGFQSRRPRASPDTCLRPRVRLKPSSLPDGDASPGDLPRRSIWMIPTLACAPGRQRSRPHQYRIAVSNSFGFGGSNTSLVLRGGPCRTNPSIETGTRRRVGGFFPARRTGPVVIVTGASSSIGRRSRCQLALSGYRVGLIARRGDLIADVARRSVQPAVALPRQRPLMSAVAHAGQRSPSLSGASDPIDVMVANAGFGGAPTHLDPLNIDEVEQTRCGQRPRCDLLA